MSIAYNETKRQTNLLKHGIDFTELTSFFDGTILTREDTRAAYGELRFQSVGWCADRMLFVVWIPGKNDWPHVISARKAEKYERDAWAKFVGK